METEPDETFEPLGEAVQRVVCRVAAGFWSGSVRGDNFAANEVRGGQRGSGTYPNPAGFQPGRRAAGQAGLQYRVACNDNRPKH